MKVIINWIVVFIVEFVLILGLYNTIGQSIREEKKLLEMKNELKEQQDLPIPNISDDFSNDAQPKSQIINSIPEQVEVPKVISTYSIEEIPIVTEEESGSYHQPNGKQYDLKIEAGVVSFTLNGGTSWTTIPISSSQIQDFWLTYYRLGDQSYYIDENVILILCKQEDENLNLIVSTDKGQSYNVVEIDLKNYGLEQAAITISEDGGYRMALLVQSCVLYTATSLDGISWTFNEPSIWSEPFVSVYGMSLMKNGMIFITEYDDCSISMDDGKTFASLKDNEPQFASQIDFNYLPYQQEDGTYVIVLKNQKIATSTNGIEWKQE